MKIKTLNIEILGIPQSKQSFRHRIIESGNKKFIGKYQSAKVKKDEDNIRSQIVQQLPEDFIPFDGIVFIDELTFVFPIPKNLPKWKTEKILNFPQTIHRYKISRPDMPDNLKKALYDAMSGVIFIDDSQIVVETVVRKIYGSVPCTRIKISGGYLPEYVNDKSI